MSNYEYELFDGEYFHTLNIVALDKDNMQVTIAITHAGKITVKEIDLQEDEDGLYFEYTPFADIIHINDFEYMN